MRDGPRNTRNTRKKTTPGLSDLGAERRSGGREEANFLRSAGGTKGMVLLLFITGSAFPGIPGVPWAILGLFLGVVRVRRF